ncbi:hypothetical protein [Chitinophaga rhizosphaerae]|uniref:hypothetical protein n=1 Tax=Chitinophaga rhizosphaerae TaxID=1864947 RepID=UPI000F7FF423|nr:hypothetical protein [Chitinophaga rhizosphaerae]
MNQNDRFLLYMQTKSCQQPEVPADAPTLQSWPTFHETLARLLAQPMDTFDRQIALGRGQEHFIAEAHIIDMLNGERLATLTRFNSDRPVYGNTLAFLEIAAEVPHRFFHDFKFVTKAGGGTPLLVPLLALDEQGKFLYPTPEFDHLVGLTLNKYLDHPRVANPSEWLLTLVGERITNNEQAQGQTSTVLSHYYPTEVEALSAGTKLSGTAFDMTAARKAGDHYFFESASVLQLPSEKLIAAIHLIPLPQEGDDWTAQDAGRILFYQGESNQTLEALGVPSENIHLSIPDTTIIKLDYWNTARPPVLKPTRLYEDMLEYQAGQSQASAPTSQYVTFLHADPCVFDTATERVVKFGPSNEIFYHTQDLPSAFSQLPFSNLGAFDFNLVDGDAKGHYIKNSGIFSEKGEVLLQLQLREDTSPHPQGVYMCYAEKLFEDPSMSSLGLAPLLATHSYPIDHEPGFRMLPVATRLRQDLVPTALCKRMDISVMLHQAFLLQDARPHLTLPVHQLIKAEHPFILSVGWQPLENPMQQANLFQFQRGFSLLEPALCGLIEIRDRLYGNRGKDNDVAPVFIKSAAVIRAATGEKLVEKSFDSAQGEVTTWCTKENLSSREQLIIDHLFKPPAQKEGIPITQRERRIMPPQAKGQQNKH